MSAERCSFSASMFCVLLWRSGIPQAEKDATVVRWRLLWAINTILDATPAAFFLYPYPECLFFHQDIELSSTFCLVYVAT